MKNISALLALMALAFTELVFANAVVTNVTGNVQVQVGAGTARTLRLGDQVNQGATVSTGANSTVVLKFDDGQVAALSANSKMTVSAYQYNEQARSGNILLSLINGGMRAITGLIGKNSPENVSYRAATATIGIRGTDVTVATDGQNVVVTVADGVISFTFGGRTVTIPAGQAVSIINGQMSAVDRTQAILDKLPPGSIVDALKGISANALSLAISMANTGPVSGQPSSVTSGTSTITQGTPGSGNTGGGGAGSPSRP